MSNVYVECMHDMTGHMGDGGLVSNEQRSL